MPESAHPPVDRKVAIIAARQHGVISSRQLEACGLSARGARARAAAWRLARVHRGVYSVGHAPLPREGRWMAAVLACGEGAVLSHRSAAELWGLLQSARASVDVISPGRAGRSIRGLDSHRPGGLTPTDVTAVRGIPCTTVARTLLDLAEIMDRRRLERACDRAEMLRLFDLRAVHELLERSPGRNGARNLQAILGEHYGGLKLTRSELEERFLALCRRAGMPAPQVNAWVPLDGSGVEVDFLWRERHLVVETDGRAVHGTRQAFERDRRKDQRLLLAGYRVVRLTWRQIASEPRRVGALIAALLER